MYMYNEKIKICMAMIHTNLILILVVSSEQGKKDEDRKTFSCFFKIDLNRKIICCDTHFFYFSIYLSISKFKKPTSFDF